MTSRNGFNASMVAKALTAMAETDAVARQMGFMPSPEDRLSATLDLARDKFSLCVEEGRKAAALLLAAQRDGKTPTYMTVESVDAFFRAFFDPFAATLYALAGKDIPYDLRAALPVIPKPKHEPETRRHN